ncbi:type II toxin-antitoxin system HicA family toxin [Patescibacteria group bacterium]
MPKLPTLTSKKLVKVLVKLGFEKHRQKGTSHLVMVHNDKRRCVIPMHSGDIPKGTLKSILRSIDVGVDELISLF